MSIYCAIEQLGRQITAKTTETSKPDFTNGFAIRDLAEARDSVRALLEKVSNQKRLRSALGYLPLAEFERDWHAQSNWQSK